MREPLRALVVDDELLARSLLKELLDEVEGVDVVGEAANGFEAVQKIEELGPDLVFLDIQMPKLSGFEVLELLGEAAPEVVFVTAYDEHALRAFEVHAVDYLLKPVDPERLRTAIERASERRSTRTGPSATELAAAARAPDRPLDRVLIREQGRILVLPVARVDYVEAQDDYLVFAVGERRFRRQQTLAELESQLDPARFVRIHRSYLLNLDRLARLELYARDSWRAVLSDGTRLPVSRSGHARLRRTMG